ncbi:thioredoxin-like protein [Dichotomocladium elegans]|nr:thioredoxin-like protein [Dichotomocladium elegans]
MTIKVGDQIPDEQLAYVPYDATESLEACPFPQRYKIHDNFKGKKVVLFAIPAAFSGTCQEKHLPGFVKEYDALKAKGADLVICIAVNDGWAMNAFGKVSGAKDKIIMAGDGNGTFTKALGLELDLTSLNMGVRSKRYAMVIDDLIVKYLGVEDGLDVDASSAEAVLKNL